MIVLVLIQYAAGRWHPAYYRLAPLPGPDMPGKLDRFKSSGHHTKGFDSLEAAQLSATALAEMLTEGGHYVRPPGDDGQYPVREMAEVGVDIVLERGKVLL